jgi:phage recombination protein Bet
MTFAENPIEKEDPRLDAELVMRSELSPDQINLVKNTIAKGATDDELELFITQCNRTQLDPFSRQIYLIGRWDGRLRTEVKQAQISIDGARLVAQRSREYRGQTEVYYCDVDEVWHDVWLKPHPPRAAKVGVYRAGFVEAVWATATWDQYVQTNKEGQPGPMWKKMGALMLGKCFDAETEVLTEHGFRLFSEVTGRIMQVTDGGLEPVDAAPFAQPYDGAMVVWKNEHLDFCVTPNHDMVTTVGKVEAGAMYATSHSRGPWKIPRLAPPSVKEAPISDSRIALSAWVLADGWRASSGWRIAVGKDRKINAIRRLGLAVAEVVRHSKGVESTSSAGRTIRSNFDQVVFQFTSDDAPLVTSDKGVDREVLLSLSTRQARLFIDTWVEGDGHRDRRSGVVHLYSSRIDHLDAIEVAAVMARYSVSPRSSRVSDIGTKPNYVVTVSDRDEMGVRRHFDNSGDPTLALERSTGTVWCVTVPSGKIIVRRQGFSFVCGNCAEALALRKAFPMELSGLYTTEEMMQATSAPAVAPNPGGAVTDDGEVTTTRMGPPSGAQGATAAHTEDVELLRSLIVSMSPSAKVAMATRWKESSIPPLDHGLTDVECAAATSLAYDVMADDALAGDVVDAEIVNEGSEEAGDQGIGFEVKLVSQKMVSAIYALFKDIGIPDHDDNHDEAERILGLDDLRSFKNLSMAEGKKLIDTLQARKDAL